MPVFQKTQPREDIITRRAITAEDLVFLAELQRELNTQDTMGNRDPRFWVIKQTESVVADENDFDEVYLVSKGSGTEIKSLETLGAYLTTQGYAVSYDSDTDMLYVLERGETALNSNKSNYDYIYNSMQGVINDIGDREELETLAVKYTRRQPRIVEDTLFLTHRECENHLKKYGYNYKPDAHAYAMTAIRSPQFEKLIGILQTVNFNAIAAALE